MRLNNSKSPADLSSSKYYLKIFLIKFLLLLYGRTELAEQSKVRRKVYLLMRISQSFDFLSICGRWLTVFSWLLSVSYDV